MTPTRCDPANIEAFLAAMRVLLYEAADKDLRIAQVVGNIGDCYYMEDDEYVSWVQNNCD